MGQSAIKVKIDDRIRLLSSVLALTTWPEEEQHVKPHGVHAHARSLRSALAHAEQHPAVMIMQELMEQGYTLDTIFSYSNALSWPGIRARAGDVPAWAPDDWSVQLREFMHGNRISEIWNKDKQAWAQAEEQAVKALSGSDPANMLSKFFGEINAELVFQPNLCYPTGETIGFRSGKSLICVCPPPIAWGTNPPWPYDDNPADPYREAFSTYARILLREMLEKDAEAGELARKNRLPVPNTFLARYPNVEDQFSILLISGMTAIALAETSGKAESESFIMMAHKAHGFKVLPAVIDVLRHYLDEHASGKFTSFAEYLPAFFKSLQVATRMMKI